MAEHNRLDATKRNGIVYLGDFNRIPSAEVVHIFKGKQSGTGYVTDPQFEEKKSRIRGWLKDNVELAKRHLKEFEAILDFAQLLKRNTKHAQKSAQKQNWGPNLRGLFINPVITPKYAYKVVSVRDDVTGQHSDAIQRAILQDLRTQTETDGSGTGDEGEEMQVARGGSKMGPWAAVRHWHSTQPNAASDAHDSSMLIHPS